MTANKKINLLKGSPGADLLPTEQLQKGAQTALSQEDVGRERGPLDYGSDPGYQPLRENIAKWLTEFYRPSHQIEAERICVSGGASQNMACILQVFTDLGTTRHIWFVEPVYHLAVRIFEDAGFHSRLRAVPENSDGIDLEYFDKCLSEAGQTEPGQPTKPMRPYSKTYQHILYCVPTFSNPSGKTMPFSTRQELVRIARKHDVLVICDDVYDFLQWPTVAFQPQERGSQVPRLVDVDATFEGGPRDDFGHVVSNGSFSKIVAPGVRVGWAEGTASFAQGLSQAGSSRSGGAPSQMTSTFINQMIQSGSLDQHIVGKLVPAYRRRHATTVAAIQEHLLPRGVRIDGPSQAVLVRGGYFVWIELPEGLKAGEVAAIALEKESLVLAPGPMFACPGRDDSRRALEKHLRICFAWEDEASIVEGLERLARVLDRFER